MRENMERTVDHSKQKRGQYLHLDRQRFIARRLDTAFLAIVADLKCVPSPRHPFDNRRREGNTFAPVGSDAVAIGQTVMSAAIQTGDRTVIESTAQRIRHWVAEIEAAMLVDYNARANAAPCIQSIGLTAHKEVGEAAHAMTHAMVSRSPGDAERAIQEANEARVALGEFVTTARLSLVGGHSVHAMR